MDMNRAAFGPIVCPVLIGRTPSLEFLLHLMEQASGGLGQTVLIAGEAGIGKSRLVREATALLRSSESLAPPVPVLTLVGHCFEQDAALPYAPLLDLLRTCVATRDPDAVAASLVPLAAEFVKLLPELAAFLPVRVRDSALDPEQEKRRLYQALLDLLTRLSATGPLLLVIEDLHWSDEVSLGFLLYLARHVRPHSMLLLLTYRSEEVHPELARFLAALDRERLAPELRLSRLSIDEVGAMVRAILTPQRPIDAGLLAILSQLSEGNPFFIEEILKSLITEGEISSAQGDWVSTSMHELQIPRSVQLAVQQRLDHLSPGARELLSLAAVAGRRFDFALLQQLTRRSEAELVQLIKESITAQLVVEESEEVFAFRHALTREAVYKDLLARERKALHRSIAETREHLETSGLEAHLGDLAYHFYEAGVWGKALEYAQRAGKQAQQLYAPQAALEHFTHAVQSAHHLSVPVPFDLYRARGQAYQTLGAFEHARSDYEQALHTALDTHNQVVEWQSLLDLGYLWTERNLEQAGDYFQRAIELAREMGEQSTLAHTLNRIGNWYANREQPHEALHFHQEALEIFHRLNDQHGLAETLDVLGTTCLAAGLLPSGITYYEQAIALLRALGDRQLLISSLGMATMRCSQFLSDTLIWLPTGNAACIHDAEEAVALARQIDWRAGEAFALSFLGLGLAARGEYAGALTCGQAALDIAEEIEHGLWMTFAHFLLGSLSLDLLALPSARQRFEQAFSLAKESGSLFWLRIITGALASTCIAQQDFARAEAVLPAVTDALPQRPTVAQRIAWCAQAELDLALDRPESALQVVDHLIASARVEPGGSIPRLWHLRGKALIACDRKGEAETVLQAAHTTAQAQGIRSALWRICLTLGKLFASRGQRGQAEGLFAEARTTLEELATHVPDETVRASYLHSATTQLPSLPDRSPGHALKQAFGGLTEREREVARLVAQGKSNRALADELVVSERTVEKHVERIMFKLGFSSRAQIAVWAVEKGLIVHSD